MTAPNLENIQKQLTDLKFNAQNIRIVTVSKMPDEALQNSTSKEDECFYNSYMNVIFRHGERYVLGYRCEMPLVDHAIIRKGDFYFDPTLQANADFESYQFAVLAEFKVFDVMKHAKSNHDLPPDVDYLRTKTKHFKNILSV